MAGDQREEGGEESVGGEREAGQDGARPVFAGFHRKLGGAEIDAESERGQQGGDAAEDEEGAEVPEKEAEQSEEAGGDVGSRRRCVAGRCPAVGPPTRRTE